MTRTIVDITDGALTIPAPSSTRGGNATGDPAVPHGAWLVVRSNAGRELGAVHVTDGEESVLRTGAKLPPKTLSKTLFLDEVRVDPGRDDVPPALLYLAARHARIAGRTTLAMLDADRSLSTLGGFARLGHVPPVAGGPFAAQRVDVVAHHAFTAAPEAMKRILRKAFVPEAVATLESWLATFFQTGWFKAIEAGRLSREQYAYTLANQYQYVRSTTRHIGAAVALSADRDLRNHWRHHLEGEVDHERIIEKDLANLGVDVDFVVNHMVPHPDTMAFCLVQEAILGFRRNPVLFFAAPFVVEGFSAHLDAAFIANLDRCAKRWGIENPRHVTNFIASHIGFDGGDDGHWAAALAMIERHLASEKEQQEFLAVAHACMTSFERSYQGFTEELALYELGGDTRGDVPSPSTGGGDGR
jgi:hypothetical protein